jgi:uncharacterized membrane protein YhhN
MKKIFLYIFFIVSAAELVSQLADISWLHHLSKPLIMVALGSYYSLSAGKESRSGMVLTAVVFSFLGDAFLMYETINELYFMIGLASFLLAHLFYTFAYRKHTVHDPQDKLDRVRLIRMGFPVVLAGTGLVVVLYPSLGDLRGPVMVYALVLMVMVLTALSRLGKTNSQSFWKVFAGALLFLVSDSLLAINKFLDPVPAAGVMIMFTYIAAQFLIIEGLLDHARAGVPRGE